MQELVEQRKYGKTHVISPKAEQVEQKIARVSSADDVVAALEASLKEY